MEEALTLHRPGTPLELWRSLCSTNLIDSLLSVTHDLTRRVTRWQGWAWAAKEKLDRLTQAAA